MNQLGSICCGCIAGFNPSQRFKRRIKIDNNIIMEKSHIIIIIIDDSDIVTVISIMDVGYIFAVSNVPMMVLLK